MVLSYEFHILARIPHVIDFGFGLVHEASADLEHVGGLLRVSDLVVHVHAVSDFKRAPIFATVGRTCSQVVLHPRALEHAVTGHSVMTTVGNSAARHLFGKGTLLVDRLRVVLDVDERVAIGIKGPLQATRALERLLGQELEVGVHSTTCFVNAPFCSHLDELRRILNSAQRIRTGRKLSFGVTRAPQIEILQLLLLLRPHVLESSLCTGNKRGLEFAHLRLKFLFW